MKKLFYLPLLLLAFSGCQPDPLPLDIESAETKLVIASQIVPNEFMLVTVTKSFGALESRSQTIAIDSTEEDSVSNELLEQIIVANARVTVSYLDITDTLTYAGNGLYTSVSTPQFLNVDYVLQVEDSLSGLTASSTERMLELVQFENIEAIRATSNNLEFVQVDYGIQDPEGPNWYMVNFYASRGTNDFSPFNLNAARTETVLLSDQSYATNMINSSHKLYDWEDDTVIVAVSNISRDYFDYLALRQKSGDSVSEFLSEPISYPSNVNNGYGYFTTHYPDVRVFTVPQ